MLGEDCGAESLVVPEAQYASIQCQVEVRMCQQAGYNVPRSCRMIKVVPSEPFSQISWYTGHVKMDDCVQHLGTTGSNMGCGFHFCIRFGVFLLKF